MNQEHQAHNEPRPAMPERDEQILRLEKLSKIKAETTLPYRFEKTHTNTEIIKNFDQLSESKQIVKVAGRLIAKREHGKTKFGHLLDQTDKIQVYFRKDFLADSFDKLDLVDIGDLLGIEGEVFKTHTNEITVVVRSYTVLNKSLHPMPEKWHGLKDVEMRYRQRYLDLIANPESKKMLINRSYIVSLMRRFFDSRGFIEFETPILQPIYGGAAAKPFETFYNVLEEKMYPDY